MRYLYRQSRQQLLSPPLALLLIAAFAGCTHTVATQSFTETDDTSQLDSTPRLPVIFVPGLQGSTLRNSITDERIWGSFHGDYADPGDASGMRQFALPMRVGATLDSLRDDVVADGLLSRFSFNLLRLLPIYADGYNFLIRDIEKAGYSVEPAEGSLPTGSCYSAFVFIYDWRRDNVENAKLLSSFAKRKKAWLEDHDCFVSDDHRFDLVSHSMGGLVARYFLQYGEADLGTDGPLPEPTWIGAKLIRNVVLAASPNSGSLDAFRVLVEGRKYLDLDRYEPAILGTMPALYQLLPRQGGGTIVMSDDTTVSAGDLFDVDTWRRNKWGLADPDQLPALQSLLPSVSSDSMRREIAIDHLEKSLRRASRFRDALEVQAPTPSGLTMHILVGDTKPTDAILSWNLFDRSLRVEAKEMGDTIVLASSTRLSSTGFANPQITTAFVPGRHMSMTRGDEFGRQMVFSLLGCENNKHRRWALQRISSHILQTTRFFLPHATQPIYLQSEQRRDTLPTNK